MSTKQLQKEAYQTLKRLRSVLRTISTGGKQRVATLGLMSFAYFFIFSVHLVHALAIPGWLQSVFTVLKYIGYVIAIVSAVGFLLWGAGNLFDAALNTTILDFAKKLGSAADTGSLMNAIYTIWTASRDIANILIIGMFVYIAINKILGTKQDFKKVIVSLLSVAVLINFSFFFAQSAIDISNWSAVQVYNAISPEAAANDTAVNNVNLSETIVHNMRGVSMKLGVWEESVKSFKKNMSITAFFGILPNIVIVTLLTLITAILFFRMAFILIGRWLVLVILMATSSLAFAAMLIPSLRKYWEQWYNGLIYNTIVAPLLLLLLWAVTILMIAVSRAFNLFEEVPKLPVGEAAKDIGAVSNFSEAIVGFALTVGLLWAAIHIATMLSSKAADSAGGIGKGVSNLLGRVEGLGYGGAAAGFGWAGRNTHGAGFSWMGKKFENGAQRTAHIPGLGSALNGLSKMSKKQGDRGLDLRSTNLAKEFGKSASVSMGKANTEGFQALAKRREKEQKGNKEAYNKKITEETREKLANEAEAQRRNQQDKKDLAEKEQEIRKQNKETADSITQMTKDQAALSTKKTDNASKGQDLVRKAAAANTKKEQLKKEKQSIESAAQEAVGELDSEGAKIEQIKSAMANNDATEALHLLQETIAAEDYALSTMSTAEKESTSYQERKKKLRNAKRAHSKYGKHATNMSKEDKILSDSNNQIQNLQAQNVEIDKQYEDGVKQLQTLANKRDVLEQDLIKNTQAQKDAFDLAELDAARFTEQTDAAASKLTDYMGLVKPKKVDIVSLQKQKLGIVKSLSDKGSGADSALRAQNQADLNTINKQIAQHARFEREEKTIRAKFKKEVLMTDSEINNKSEQKRIAKQLEELLKPSTPSVDSAKVHTAQNAAATAKVGDIPSGAPAS